MEKALEKKFEKVEEELNWSGLHLDDMAEVTEYTLERLREYLDEIGAPNEAAIIQEALDCVETHIVWPNAAAEITGRSGPEELMHVIKEEE